MIENIRLFSINNNKFQEPNQYWTQETTIYCSFELNLNYSTKKLIWDKWDLIKLKDLIAYIIDLNIFVPRCDKNLFTFSLNRNDSIYFFNWELENDLNLKVIQQYNNTTNIILQKSFIAINILNFKKNLFVEIMNNLSSNTNNEVTTIIGELFYINRDNSEFEFKIGQKVETVLGQNVKTKRIGLIANKFYHYKNKTNMYQILVAKNILAKRYLPTDLRIIE